MKLISDALHTRLCGALTKRPEQGKLNRHSNTFQQNHRSEFCIIIPSICENLVNCKDVTQSRVP